MSFDTLPGIRVSWAESAEPLASFLRYEVWRRVQGETEWKVVALLRARSLTSYTDLRVAGGTVYEYAVVVVGEVSGEPIYSPISDVVSGMAVIKSTFIHDAQDPSYYVQLSAQQNAHEPDQAMTFVQPRGALDPVAHIGRTLTTTLTFTLLGQWADAKASRNGEAWDALVALQMRQREGSILVCRAANGVLAYCVISDLQRTDRVEQVSYTVKLQRVTFDDTPV